MEEKIPQKSETIAAKRAARLAVRLEEARKKFSVKPAWWSETLYESLVVLAILALNAFLVWPYFGTASPPVKFSGPVIPFLASLVNKIGVAMPYAIQIINICFFLLFPLSLYYFIRKVTQRKMAALLGVILATLPFYPFAASRTGGMFLGEDGPHMASLSIVPVALGVFLSFLREGKARNLLIGSVLIALVGLVSPFGLLTFLIFAAITVFSEMLLGGGRLKLFRFLAILFFAAALSSFWYNPAFFFWMVTGPMGFSIKATGSRLIPVSFFIIPVLGSFGYLLFDRKPDLQPVFLASFYAIAFGLVALVGKGVSLPSQPARYSAELGISLAFLLAIAATKLGDLLKFSQVAFFSSIYQIYRSLFVDATAVIIFLSLTALILFGRNQLLQEETNVLGAWDEIAKADIWMAREQFGGFHAYVGYTITGLTLSMLTFMGIKTKLDERPH